MQSNRSYSEPCPVEGREENADRLISLIGADLNNGRQLYGQLFRRVRSNVRDPGTNTIFGISETW